jgi:hypothetical protein
MKWFRTNISQGSRLALLALVIQLGLTFGHVHAGHAQTVPVATRHVVRSAAMHTSRVALDAEAFRVVRTKTPSNDHSDHEGADGCAICAVLALAGVMLSVTPHALPAPHAAEFAYLITNTPPSELNCVDAAFQPRAPPIA